MFTHKQGTKGEFEDNILRALLEINCRGGPLWPPDWQT